MRIRTRIFFYFLGDCFDSPSLLEKNITFRCCEEVAERDEEIIRLKSEILGLKSDLLESREFRIVSQRSRSENIARTTHEEEEEYCSRCRELSNTLANIQNLHIKGNRFIRCIKLFGFSRKKDLDLSYLRSSSKGAKIKSFALKT